jgi:putative heme iron utilization protein
VYKFASAYPRIYAVVLFLALYFTMSDQLSPEVSSRICKHMNEDHANAVLLYAQFFGGVPQATAAQMLAIDAQGMDLTTQANGDSLPVRIQFDHVLADSEDAHHTLIAMMKQARVEAKG